MISGRTRTTAILYFCAIIVTLFINVLSDRFLIVVIPLILGLLTWQSIRKHRENLRQSRIRHGLCPACCYDLRGITSDRCPECGVTIAGKAEPRTQQA